MIKIIQKGAFSYYSVLDVNLKKPAPKLEQAFEIYC
jgi:hypothetical protein